ncbi:non-structural maintenance of chromosomes element 4 homolog A-like [Rhododendron vialii]|uniref:non-structural maintenance of chromosomes element 4 homolog A-like n=1 Tax=Rhododendron vialii TaxID=182163 RepID=UPI00265DA1CB|nr:non-structural maintenance of chromosomes element 4 homolog A-like [Rhododendron vialii]
MMKKSKDSRHRHDEFSNQDQTSRRLVRSKYTVIKKVINENREDISSVDSEKFNVIISKVEDLHRHVEKPREQVADGEALLDLAKIVKSSAKSYASGEVTPSDFISSLLRNYTKTKGRQGTSEPALNSIFLKEIGFAVSPIFKIFQGCCTMLGPMQTQPKQRKVAVYRKRVKLTQHSKPEELDSKGEEKTDTDKNMFTMFEILKKKKSVRLESLVLNRKSFAQTVENIFALSFLVKDGRVEFSVDEKGSHLASPKDAPDTSSIISGEKAYSHFVFRYDFNDWKLMLDILSTGEELMPHRDFLNNSSPQEGKPTAANDMAPVKKLARKCGPVEHEQPFVDSPEIADGIRRCKPKLQ